MNEAKNQSLQSHSVQGYMQRLHTKELLQLLHFYIENEPNITFSVKEIIHILENRSDKSKSDTAVLQGLEQAYQQKNVSKQ